MKKFDYKKYIAEGKLFEAAMPCPAPTQNVALNTGILGYCWMHHFKCHSARSCNTWAAGGPIGMDSVSYDWQERNKKQALDLEPIDPDLYKDD